MMAGLKAVKVEKGFGFALGTVASGGISGGIASVIGGGTFGAGFRNGAISAGLNHLAHENGWYDDGEIDVTGPGNEQILPAANTLIEKIRFTLFKRTYVDESGFTWKIGANGYAESLYLGGISNIFLDGMGGKGPYSIYAGYKNGKLVYIGLTRNFQARAKYWYKARGYELKQIYSNINSKGAARAIEQWTIEKFGINNLDNIRNSISIGNKKILEYYRKGIQYLKGN